MARSTYSKSPKHSVVSHNAMMTAFAESGHLRQCVELFETTDGRDMLTWNSLVGAYVENGASVDVVLRVLDHMPMYGTVSWTVAITALAEKGHFGRAKELFDSMPRGSKDSISWNALLAAFIATSRIVDSKRIFDLAPKHGEFSVTSMITAYGRNLDIAQSKRFFDTLCSRGLIPWNSMITAFGDNSLIEDAKATFEKMPMRNTSSWNAMLQAYSQNGELPAARVLFSQIPAPNAVSRTALAYACSLGGHTDESMRIFHAIPDKNLISRNAMLTAYAHDGRVADARNLFDAMLEDEDLAVDLITWNAMLQAYALNGHGLETLDLFQNLELHGVDPDELSFLSVLLACNHLGMASFGRSKLLSMIADHGVGAGPDHYGSMVDLLGRSGRTGDAEELILTMPFFPDQVAWGSLLAACRKHNDLDRGSRAAEILLRADDQASTPYLLLASLYRR
ncbi:pentatricopeptide repeat-containing protein At4g02750-like [Selaginella moellendorffii]|uniref:pentatricopeptide repeat-containing protein At4g02750-like n=1 Tax=Selaginella moellendorffii TaxID=88036 RepID=UPI000D1CC6E8|nr:pentatricopeptide repeat-containing protein At4g02750-like [Selaginella moellendorffii]|eukprot:XP_024531677.1 pentatricopeptide repeat-containing protein At4g02750-like [Selaginella moellendorffii]